MVGNEVDAIAGIDVHPATGTVQFVSEQTSAVLKLDVISDEVTSFIITYHNIIYKSKDYLNLVISDKHV